jgi:hypothetical protein
MAAIDFDHAPIAGYIARYQPQARDDIKIARYIFLSVFLGLLAENEGQIS